MVPKASLASYLAGVAWCCSCSSLHNGGDASPEATVPDGAVSCPDASVDDDFSLLLWLKGRPCASAAPVCELTLTTPCDGGPDWADPGATNGWTCACKDGEWDCVVTSQGGGGGCGVCEPIIPTSISNSCFHCCDPGGALGACFSQCTNYLNCFYCTCSATDTTLVR